MSPNDLLTASELDDLLELNRLRAGSRSERLEALEERFSARFGANRRLAVYGSLAPGRSNHDRLRYLAGEWLEGHAVRGERVESGWGASLGYRALRWSLDGPSVPIHLFVSDDLPLHWDSLDRFEGPEYLRILVPVLADERVVAVANLYGARS